MTIYEKNMAVRAAEKSIEEADHQLKLASELGYIRQRLRSALKVRFWSFALRLMIWLQNKLDRLSRLQP